MPSIEKEKVDILITKFLVACDISLSVVQSEHLNAVLNTLRPSYHPPELSDIKDNLIDKVYDESVASIQNSNNTSQGFLMMLTSEIQTKIVLKPQKSAKVIFLESCQSGEKLNDCILSAIEKCRKIYNIEVKFLCWRSLVESIETFDITIPWYNCTITDAEDIAKKNLNASTLMDIRKTLHNLETDYLLESTGYK